LACLSRTAKRGFTLRRSAHVLCKGLELSALQQ